MIQSTVKFSQIKDRFDAEYYKPGFLELGRLISKSKIKFIRLGDIASRIRYGTSEKVAYQEKGISFLRVTDIDDFFTIEPENGKFISRQQAEKLKNFSVSKGELLVSRTGTLGSVVYITERLEGSIFGSYFIKVTIQKNTLSPIFVSVFLNSPWGKLQTERAASGGIQTNITIEMIQNLLIPELRKNDQERIAQIYIEAVKTRRKAKELVDKSQEEVEKIIKK